MDDNFGPLLIALIFYVIVFGVAGFVIGKPKGIAENGALLGALLGPIGLVITAFMGGNRENCRFCNELISPAASVCPHCQRDLRRWATNVAVTYPDVDSAPPPLPQIVPKPPPPPQSPQTDSYFLYINDEVKGPFSVSQINALLQVASVTSKTKCCPQGTQEWNTIADYIV
jgi:hypothetical protein